MLPGAVYHLFFKDVYLEQLNVYLTILVMLFFACVALLLAKMVVTQPTQSQRNTLLVLIIFYLSGPCTFSIFTYQLGILDFYWLPLSALFMLLVSNKYLKYLIPLIFALSILVHFSCFLSYLILYSLILLFRIATAEDKKEKRGFLIVFACSLVLSLVLTVYFITHEQNNLTYSFDAFHREQQKRTLSFDEIYRIYYDDALYKYYEEGNISFERARSVPLLTGTGAFAQIINGVYAQFKKTMDMYDAARGFRLRFFFSAGLLAPLYALFVKYWARKIKEGSRLQKITCCLCIVQFPFTMLGALFSPDVSRFLTHAFLIQFTLFFYVLFKEKETNVIKALLPRFIGSREVLIYYLIYAITFFDPYK